MKKPSLLIIGCGAIGNAIAAQNSVDSAWQLHGARRNIDKLAPGIIGHSIDYSDEGLVCQLLSDCVVDYLLLTFTPREYSSEGYQQSYVAGMRNVLAAIQQPPKRIVFVSSTSVYGQCDGEWVDEMSDTAAPGFSGQAMLQCEQMLADSAIPSTSLRCGGIYNSTSTRLVEAVKQRRFSASNHFTNRIHRYDCAAAILHLLNQDRSGQGVQPLYLGVDSEPARKQDVERWLAEQLDVDYPKSKPEHTDSAIAQRSPGSKRCSNRRLIDSGFQFRYPGYRDGYRKVIDLMASSPSSPSSS